MKIIVIIFGDKKPTRQPQKRGEVINLLTAIISFVATVLMLLI